MHLALKMTIHKIKYSCCQHLILNCIICIFISKILRTSSLLPPVPCREDPASCSCWTTGPTCWPLDSTYHSTEKQQQKVSKHWSRRQRQMLHQETHNHTRPFQMYVTHRDSNKLQLYTGLAFVQSTYFTMFW